MRFLDLFAGIGGFRNGLEKSGHKCIGHVEIDKFANRSYMAMYKLENCKFGKIDNNSCMICKKEVFNDCNGKKCCGEWYAKDIKGIRAEEIPKAEIWTFGFPCTDISVCGKMVGLSGERSGLFFNVIGLLKSTKTENKPKWLIIENVKHLIASKDGGDFTAVLFELYETGYECEWSVVNSKDFGVPQSRERVYIIGYIREKCGGKIFPVGRTNKAVVKNILNGSQGKRMYASDGLAVTLTSVAGGFGGKTGLYAVKEKNLYSGFIDLDKNLKITLNSRCLRTRQNSGINNHTGETSGIIVCSKMPDIALPICTPERKTVRQNGRRIKNVNEPMFTLTTVDRHGIILVCMENKCYFIRIRRLTPKECFRLQGFDDILFDRAKAAGISDNQLYKQAGNAMTTNIAYEIGLKLKEIENGKDDEK